MRALYDMSRYLSSFNFFEWLVQVEANGASMVVFDATRIRGDKWPHAIATERFHSICVPGPALIELPHEIVINSDHHAKDMARPGGAGLVRFCKSGKAFKRLRTVETPRDVKYTVTLRKTQRSPLRDSDEAVWREFAKEIGAFVIPDYDEKPIHLHERMAWYAGADMNFFVSNGPGILCSLSDYPCMMFNTHHARESLLGDGLKDGEQYPWLMPNQRAIWELATPRSLRFHFDHWYNTGKFADDGYVPKT